MPHTPTEPEDQTPRPWYRYPWVWLLILFPAMSIIYCIVAITLSLQGQNSMVVDDYSEEGVAINQSLARDAAASDLGLEAEINKQGRDLIVQLNSTQESLAGGYGYLILKLFHPTLGDRDRVVQLHPEGGGYYRGQIPGDINGRWYLDLSDPDQQWRLKGEGTFPADSGFELRPDETERG